MITSGNVADFLLTFAGAERAQIPQRSPAAAPTEHTTDHTWSLTLLPARDSWVGMPCQTAAAGHLRAWLFGELYTGSLQCLLDQIAENIHAPIDFNGHALLIAWEAAARRWHIWTNRFGTLHAYHKPGALGTFSPAVAAVGSRSGLDWTGLAGFFLWGFFPVDRTYFEDVRILPPASHTVLDDSGRIINQSRYWDWDYAPEFRRSFDETVDQFAEIFHLVMRQAVTGRSVALPISGGLDSRSTVAALPDPLEDDSLWTFSYGYTQNSPEIHIARQVADARSLPFNAYVIPPYLFANIREVTNAVEGFQDITQCRQAAFAHEIGAHAGHVIAAHWGDVWFDQAGADSAYSTADLALKKFFKPGRDWLLENLILPRMPHASQAAHDLMRTVISGYAQIHDEDFRLKAVKTDLWSARWTTASLRAYQHGAFPILPFYDNRIADFFCTVPAAYLAGRALQIAYLKRYAPDLARISWQAYDADLYQYQHFHTWQLPSRAVKKFWRVLSRQRVIQRNWEAQFLSPGGRAGLETWLLAPSLRLHEFVSPARLSVLLNEFYARPGSRENGYVLSMLLTFSAWLEQYAS